MFLSILIFIFILGILVLAHELGHFLVAKRRGVKVEEFGFGFPPRIASKIKNNIRYSLNLLPFGGFVKIYGENGEGVEDPASFTSRPAWQRMLILGAGVLMNLLLAWIFFIGVAAIGVPQINDDSHARLPVSIINISPHSPAEQNGLHFGDQIIELRADSYSLRVEEEKDVSDFVAAYRGEEITMVVRRGNNVREIKLTPRVNTPANEGPLGISMGRLSTDRVVWFKTPLAGMQMLAQTLAAIVGGLWFIIGDLLRHAGTNVSVSGPVGIYFFSRDLQGLGINYMLQFVALLSANLAVLNALPIPALDGGRMFFVLIEKIRGRRMNREREALAHALGFALLILMMVIVTYNDITNLFS